MHVREMREQSVLELQKYVIIDSQGGMEDFIALFISLELAKKHGKTILGITCVNGRRNLQQGARNAALAVKLSQQKYEIPVFKGAKHSILLNKTYPNCIDHDQDFTLLDQLCDKHLTQEDTNTIIQDKFAPLFIAEQIRKYGPELSIVTLGPLTNLALAFYQTQNITNLSSIRINGGSFTGVGNVVGSFCSEGNFNYDPQAAHIVMTQYKNIYINPIEKTLETSWKQVFTTISEQSNSFIFNDILKHLIKKQYTLCGPLLTILPIFKREVVTKVYQVYAEVMTSGKNIEGLLASNWLRLEVKENQQLPNVKIYSAYDLQLAKKLIETI